MSVPPAAIRRMAELGLSSLDIADLCELICGHDTPDALERRRAYDRERKRVQRKSGGKSGGQNADMSNGSPVESPVDTPPLARVVNIKPSTEISGHGKNIEADLFPSDAPKRSGKKFALPTNWEPLGKLMTYALDQGLTPEEITDAAFSFRNHWCGSGTERTDWSGKWLDQVKWTVDRKRDRAKGVARSASASGGGRGSATIVDLVFDDQLRASQGMEVPE